MPLGDKIKSSIGPNRAPITTRLFQRYAPDAVIDLVGNLTKLGSVFGLGEPSSAYAGPAQATIAQLAASEKAWPALKKAMEWIAKKYPRLSNLVANSEFVDELAGGLHTGEYNPATNTAKIAIKKFGQPRHLADIIATVGHEHFGHGLDLYKGTARGKIPIKPRYEANEIKDAPEYAKEYFKEKALPYDYRPSEIRAATRGDQLRQAFKKSGIKGDLSQETVDFLKRLGIDPNEL